MRRAPVLLVGLVAGGCVASPDRPPIARITPVPAAIVAGDDFQTAVMLDGSASRSLDDLRLTFAWQLLDDEIHADGPLDQPMIVVHCLGERVPRIVLVVTDEHDQTGEVARPIALTVP